MRILISKYYIHLLATCVALIYSCNLSAQEAVIKLNNPSFEEIPRVGTHLSPGPRGWFDCGFNGETPPDIQPSPNDTLFFNVNTKPSDGDTYLGMVVRDNETWERVSQRLNSPMIGGSCYSFSMDLCRSDTYRSPTKESGGEIEMAFTEPATIKIWGGTTYCSKKEQLHVTDYIKNTDWKKFEFTLKPTKNYSHIMIEAFYKTPAILLYNGNVLVDNLSDLVLVDCDTDEPLFAAVEEKAPEKPKVKLDKKKIDPSTAVASVDEVVVEKPEDPKPKVKKPKIITALDDELKIGQTIRIDKLYFAADTSAISENSYEVLDEVFDFLMAHPNVVVEIGGHTNMIPDHDYANDLSENRAKAVAYYLAHKGVSNTRLRYKGYGKTQPLTFGRTAEAQKKNQRVEIKILSLNG